jgi:hypothetical protein
MTTFHPFPPKLTLAEAEDIRTRHAAGEAPRTLATEYGIALSSVYDVLRGRAHPPRLLVPVTSLALARLLAAAKQTGASPEKLAAALIEGALSSLPQRESTRPATGPREGRALDPQTDR